MRLVKLSELRVHGLVLTAQESVAVVHEVCRLMHEAAQHDRPMAAPTLAELYVDETGGVIIEPVHPARPGGDSMALLLDELLPAHLDDVPPGPPRGGSYLAGDTTGARERTVLRALYRRVSALVMAPAFEPESTPADDQAPASPLPVDDSLEWLDTQADSAPPSMLAPPPVSAPPLASAPAPTPTPTRPPAPPAPAPVPVAYVPVAHAPEATVEPELSLRLFIDSAEPVDSSGAAPTQPVFAFEKPTDRSRKRSGWQRRAVIWGVAIDVALGALVAFKLGLIPSWEELVERATIRVDATHSALPPERLPDPPPRKEDEDAVQQLPDPSSVMTPQSDEAAGGVGARRGTLISGSAPSAASSTPNLIDGADHTSLSPNGRHLAFDLDRDGVRGVFIADRDGGNIELASGEGRAAAPTWSPDARYLAFLRAEPERPRVWNLWIREIETGRLTRLTEYRSGMVRGASWFPDGRRICFAHDRTLVIQDTRSGRIQPVEAPIASGLIRTPTVSPDGRRVAFEIEGSGIWIMDVDRRAMEQIIEDPSPASLAWRREADGLTYFSVSAKEWRTWKPAPRS
jgi:hypothetical protein